MPHLLRLPGSCPSKPMALGLPAYNATDDDLPGLPDRLNAHVKRAPLRRGPLKSEYMATGGRTCLDKVSTPNRHKESRRQAPPMRP
jgi:hypothetical protein